MEMVLTRETERLIETIFETGRYDSLDDMLRAAVCMLRDQDESDKLDRLRADIRVGLEQSARGESVPLNMDKLREQAHFLLQKNT